MGQHGKHLPLEFSLHGYKPQHWQAADTLTISAYMYRTLTNTWQNKFDRAIVETRVGYDRPKELFSVDAALDHFVAGDPNGPNDGAQATREQSYPADADAEHSQPNAVI